MKRKLSSALIALCVIVLLALSACTEAAFLPGGPKPAYSGNGDSALAVHFLDVGQADSALLLCDGEAMLIDGGNVADSSLVAAYLKDQKLDHLDYVVATHAHEDHVGGLSGALNVCTVGTVYAPVSEYNSTAFNNFVKYTKAQNREITVPSPGDTFSLGAATVEILGPQREYNSTNSSSIVLKVTHGEISFLFTGDAERDAEQDIMSAGYDLESTVLKVGHHGSDTSTSYLFLRSIMPEYAVISVGAENSYGHPTDDVLSRLRDADVQLYRSDMQGHIVATSDLKTVTFFTQKQVSNPTNPTQADGSGQKGNQGVPDYYIGNLKSLKFHLPTCHSLPSEENQIYFKRYEEAVDQGYSPCGYCLK